MKEIIDYIIRFLLYGNAEAAKQVGYTANEEEWQNYRVVIVPNGHLGKEIVMPDFKEKPTPTPSLKGGENNEEYKTWIIRTDIVYNTFFFISRAEELINTQRDEHGRFLAKYSILGKNNRLMIPTVDEYARMLMKLLDLPLPTPSFSQIYLTHDIDTIAHYRHLRGAIGGIVRGQWRKVMASLKDIHNDPAFTFSWLIAQDKKVEGAKRIYFVKDTEGKGYDYPQYKLDGKDFETAEQLIENSGAKIGLHSSYYGGKMTNVVVFTHMVNKESVREGDIVKIKDLYHRSHYLRCSIDDMQMLVNMGITDDFTMMFPDQVGFRLQTTRPVRWINPKTMQLTDLALHPLTVMDCTLSNSNYMNLSEDEAYFECQRLFDKVHQNAGEVVILWHNSTPAGNTYHQSLYPKLLEMICGL
ncbi:MAG: hypothetical protein IKW35_05950 [Paludibacteraceae bacterium]|nr:hypothetical protein [Paludibacteraceae bacterium]